MSQPHTGLPGCDTNAKKRIPHNIGCENQWELHLSEMEGCWRPKDPLEGLCVDS